MVIRPATREVLHGNSRVVVEPQVMAVLLTLARKQGDVVTRDDLQEACWDGRIVSDDAINRVISRVRKVAELTGGKDFELETITKVGYRLVVHGQSATGEASPKPAPRRGWVDRNRLWVAAGVFVALCALGAGWWFNARDWNRPDTALTLAVLPFDDLGPSKSDAPLAEGLSRDIRNTLSRVRGLRVVSDSSSFAAAQNNLSALDMAKRLRADFLLDGSMTREGETVRLTAELVDGWTGVNIWTASQQGPAADLEKVRQDMSAAVFEQIAARVGPRVEILTPPRRTDPKVYQLLLEAQEKLYLTTSSRMRGRPSEGLDLGDQANALIEQALAIDPGSPLALRLKGQIISMAATHEEFALGGSTAEKQTRAAEYFRKALASDPDSVPALGALGEYYRRFEWRWNDARALLERALALDPNNADTQLSYSYYLSGAGRCVEALDHAIIAIRIDPEFGWRTLGVPRALKCLGRFEESDRAYVAALDHDPQSMFILREMYLNLLVRKDAVGLEKLRAHVRDDLWKGSPPPDVAYWLDWTGVAQRGLQGDMASFTAQIEVDVLREKQGVPGRPQEPSIPRQAEGDLSWIQAVEFGVAGQPKRAVEMLEKAVRSGVLYIPETMPYGAFEFSPEVRADPRYQAIWRSDPRLAELMRMRQESVKQRQMQGYLEGKLVTPPSSAASRDEIVKLRL